MELATLVLEYIKALAWPLVVVAIVVGFRGPLARILSAVGEKLEKADTVKVGVLGQEIEISATAKELSADRQELLAASSDDREAREKAWREHLMLTHRGRSFAKGRLRMTVVGGHSVLTSPDDPIHYHPMARSSDSCYTRMFIPLSQTEHAGLQRVSGLFSPASHKKTD